MLVIPQISDPAPRIFALFGFLHLASAACYCCVVVWQTVRYRGWIISHWLKLFGSANQPECQTAQPETQMTATRLSGCDLRGPIRNKWTINAATVERWNATGTHFPSDVAWFHTKSLCAWDLVSRVYDGLALFGATFLELCIDHGLSCTYCTRLLSGSDRLYIPFGH